MREIVVYHRDDRDEVLEQDGSDVSLIVKVDRAELNGARVWSIYGQGRPRKYFLSSCIQVNSVERLNNGERSRVRGAGIILQSQNRIDELDWFRDFKKTQCGFRFGPRPVNDQSVLEKFHRIVQANTVSETNGVLADKTNTDSMFELTSSEERSNRRIVKNAKDRRKKMIAFGWYGGKFSHLDFILPNLPNGERHFCDVFGGSAAVLINRKPAAVETYNDIDSELVNFFSVLRDNGDKLIKTIALTPFSREELVKACSLQDDLSTLERARRFYVRARQTRTGLAQTSSEGRWAHCLLTSRAGMAGSVSRWLGSVEGLPEIVQRLQRVQIENAPAVEVIRRFDNHDTLFYLDPPYVHASRGDTSAYGAEMSDQDHIELAKTLQKIKGRAVISGYRTELYDDLFKTWRRIDATAKVINSSKGTRQESIWLNT